MTASGPLGRERWARVEALFDAALERPEEERDAFLEGACAGDEDLVRELRSLLAHTPGVRDGGDGITARMAAVARAADALIRSSEPAAVGHRLGAYRLEEEIGRGGMGVVYRGVRVSGDFDQTVAVKVLPGALFSPEASIRFGNERRILAGLEHPNIARLLDGGTTREGVPYVIMEYVDGLPLDRYVREHDLSLEDRVRLFLSVCSAVSHAHRNLVVHRDLKPSNILVTPDGTPKLLDFGIAKLLDPDQGVAAGLAPGDGVEVERPTVTRIMTPRFASPEQLLGRPVGTPTDVYSLGLVLYRILTGTDARGAHTDPSASGERLLQDALEREPPPPSRASGDRRLQGDLDTVVGQALRWEVDRRYESVAALADDLRRWLDHRPIAARPPSVGYRLGKFVTRHRGAVVGVTAAVALLAVQAGVFLDRIARERDQARQEAARANRTLDFVTGLFASANPWETSDPDMTARQLLARGRGRLEEELASEPAVRAEILRTIGNAYHALGVYDSAQAALRGSLALRQEAEGDGEASPETAAVMADLAGLLGTMDQPGEADSLAHRALAIRRATLPPDHRDVAASLSVVAGIAHGTGDRARADSLYREVLALLEPGDSRDMELRSTTLRALGSVLMESSRLNEADAVLQEALRIREESHGRRHPGVANVLGQIARLRDIQGRYAESEAIFREMIDWGVDLLGDDSPAVTTWYNNLASVVRAQERDEEALAIQLEVVERRRREFDGPSVSVATALNNLGNMYGNLGRFPEADATFAEALEMMRALYDDHPTEATILNNRATLAWRMGEFDRAAELQRQVLEMDRRQLGPDHEYVGTDLANLAGHLILAGRWPEAEGYARESMALLRRLHGRDNLNTASAEFTWVDWLVAAGRGDEGVELAREALAVRRAQLDEETAQVGYARSTLGAALTQAGRLAEAEAELLEARRILAEAAPEGDPIAAENERRIRALRARQDQR